MGGQTEKLGAHQPEAVAEVQPQTLQVALAHSPLVADHGDVPQGCGGDQQGDPRCLPLPALQFSTPSVAQYSISDFLQALQYSPLQESPPNAQCKRS